MANYELYKTEAAHMEMDDKSQFSFLLLVWLTRYYSTKIEITVEGTGRQCKGRCEYRAKSMRC